MVELETSSVDQGSFGIKASSFSSAHVMVPTSDVNLVTHEVGRANWWTPPKNIVQGPNVRHLEGEIHLNPDLQPSCDFQSFRIEVLSAFLDQVELTDIPTIVRCRDSYFRNIQL